MRKIKLRGIPLYLHDEDSLSDAIVKTGDFWEADILDYLLKTYPNQRTIVDVGANIGNHTVYFAEYFKRAVVLAMEPVNENYLLLEINIAPYINAAAMKCAASNKRGTVKIALHPENKGAHSIREDGEVLVPSTTLDGLHLNHVTLLKIDAERHEPEILEGAQDTIFRLKPLILVEDSANVYGALLPPEYRLIKAWPHHNTYLYGVI